MSRKEVKNGNHNEKKKKTKFQWKLLGKLFSSMCIIKFYYYPTFYDAHEHKMQHFGRNKRRKIYSMLHCEGIVEVDR